MSTPNETPDVLTEFCSDPANQARFALEACILDFQERCTRYETALREIVAGKMPCDLAAGEKNAGDLCAGRLCAIARRALEKP